MSEAARSRLGRDPSGGESAAPTTKFGRVKKKRVASITPEREKRVLVVKVTWYGTLKAKKKRQRATALGVMQIMYTTGYLNTKYQFS
jgi:hypothetical protein